MTKQVVSPLRLTLVLLNLDISCFENTLDSDQLASDEDNLFRIYTVFHYAILHLECCKYLMRSVVYELFSMSRVKDKCIYKGWSKTE